MQINSLVIPIGITPRSDVIAKRGRSRLVSLRSLKHAPSLQAFHPTGSSPLSFSCLSCVSWLNSGNRIRPVRSCYISPFLSRYLASMSLPTCSMARSQAERISAIFFCSGRGGRGIGIFFIIGIPAIFFIAPPAKSAKRLR